MADLGCKPLDLRTLMCYRYCLPFGLSITEVLNFYRTKVRRLDNLYRSKDKKLITSYFIEEINNSQYAGFVKEELYNEVYSYDLEKLMKEVEVCANIICTYYLVTLEGNSPYDMMPISEVIKIIKA
jgi:hypothetical protein